MANTFNESLGANVDALFMSAKDLAKASVIGRAWNIATGRGDTAAAARLKSQVEGIRASYGYSGGADGSQYNPVTNAIKAPGNGLAGSLGGALGPVTPGQPVNIKIPGIEALIEAMRAGKSKPLSESAFNFPGIAPLPSPIADVSAGMSVAPGMDVPPALMLLLKLFGAFMVFAVLMKFLGGKK